MDVEESCNKNSFSADEDRKRARDVRLGRIYVQSAFRRSKCCSASLTLQITAGGGNQRLH